MLWELKSKEKTPELKEFDKKVKKHFCLLPWTYWHPIKKCWVRYWLETVYVGYEWHKEEWIPTPWGSMDFEPAHWEKIGAVTSMFACKGLGWCK